jgi:hypothetical protein
LGLIGGREKSTIGGAIAALPQHQPLDPIGKRAPLNR